MYNDIEDDITHSFEKLKIELYKINCLNWIPSKGSGPSASGKTLENLLNKKDDNLAIADYNGIELKVRNIYSKYDLHLFCCAFDGKPIEAKTLLDIGGYIKKDSPNCKEFCTNICATKRKVIRNYSYILRVNRAKERLELVIFYGFTNQIRRIMSWSFDELKSRIDHKLKYLAIIPVRRQILNNTTYFKYQTATFYKFRGFEEFLKLIESGEITVTFKLSYYKYGPKAFNYYDKGTSFDIKYDSIKKLFRTIFF